MRVAVRHARVRYARHVAVTAQPGCSLALQEHVSERQRPLERVSPPPGSGCLRRCGTWQCAQWRRPFQISERIWALPKTTKLEAGNRGHRSRPRSYCSRCGNTEQVRVGDNRDLWRGRVGHIGQGAASRSRLGVRQTSGELGGGR